MDLEGSSSDLAVVLSPWEAPGLQTNTYSSTASVTAKIQTVHLSNSSLLFTNLLGF
jgi:hypothetical protein